ncbi:MAG TPA: cyclic-phosphate processing receiver domain-containing protein [Isosphaeraceae bacterium]|nr:cyclic-phosphate processing receiver domain-containing protein [Isosphaeraceae bacterium]
MASDSGNILAPADAQPAPARRQGDAGAEHVAPSPEQPCELGPHVSEAPAGRLLFLDDDPQRAIVFLNRHPDAVWVLTAKECISQLAKEWDQVHLDHDLGGEIYVDPLREDCGMEVVRWLCASEQDQLRETWFIIHSHNFEAASDMVKHLRESGYHAVYRPFGVELLGRLQDPQPQSPAAAPACRPPGPSEDRVQPGAMVSPSPGARPAGRLVAFFGLVRRLIVRRRSPGRGSPFDRQGGKGEPGQTAL